MNEFLNFIMPGMATKTKEAMTYRDIGDAIAKVITGFEITKDVYGKGPEDHGAAYRVDGDRQTEIEQFLQELDFKKKNYSWTRDNFRVDIGKDKKYTYAYITDDEGAKKSPKGE